MTLKKEDKCVGIFMNFSAFPSFLGDVRVNVTRYA